MLVLSRRVNEKIVLPTINATIQVVALKSGVVRIGLEGPDDLVIFRAEIFDPEAWESDPRRRSEDARGMVERLMHQVRNRMNSTTLASALLRQQHDRGLYEEMDGTLRRLEHEIQQLQAALKDDTPAETEKAKTPKSVRARALLVEDDLNECELLAGVLRMAGVDVSTANDGADALDYMRQHECPDFVLMDMMLPRCDGITAARSIRENPAYDGVKIFAVTGLSQDNLSTAAEGRLIDQWFQKPLNPEILIRELTMPSTVLN